MSSPAHSAARRPSSSALHLSRRLSRNTQPADRTAFAEAAMQPGRPASVDWCRANLTPLRGSKETTVLPVGMGINALAYGIRQLNSAVDKGLPVKNPIAFVVLRAQRVQRGEVRVPVSMPEAITWH